MMRISGAKSVVAMAALIATMPVASPLYADGLRDGFATPPESARPRVWWHWMNGNISTDGIEKDLDWMKRVGIGGVQNFDANLSTPQIVDKRLVYMTEEWKLAFRHAVSIAARNGMEFAIAASPGWSVTGGPWVKPEDGMKKIVWSETVVPGGKRFTGKLNAIPTNIGSFQDLARRNRRGERIAQDERPPSASGAIGVFAVPVTAAPLPQPIVRSALGPVADAQHLTDHDLETVVTIDNGLATGAFPSVIHLDYPQVVTVRSARLFLHNAKARFRNPIYEPQLHALVDGDWRTLAKIPLSTAPTTVSFPATSARRFRVVFTPNPEPPLPGLGDGVPGAENRGRLPAPPPATFAIADLRLSGEMRLNRAEEKANFAIGRAFYPIWDNSKAPGIARSDIVDLTDRMRADGTIDWTPPAGRDWRVLRMGWSLTGEENHPASPEATGLEVDKFDEDAVRRYIETYFAMYRDAVGADLFGKRGISAVLTDSIEVGASNWTPDMLGEFKARRGYDARPWLPALLGHVIDTPDATERFLYDYRQTLADLMADAHYGTVAKVAHENDLKVYGEALENGRPILGDDMAMRARADVPMAAMWMFNPGELPRPALVGDIKGAASVAKIYGQNVVAAESLTAVLAPWGHAPADLKYVMDFEFALGVNRPVIHTSAHQPSDDKVPGLSLGSVGQYFNRHDTWADMAKPWVDYMARSSFLLQQGHGHADIAYFYGEETPIAQQFETEVPDHLPVRFGYDFVNAAVLADRLTVEAGDLVVKAPGAGRYRALFLGGTSQRMTLSTLRRIADLAEAGALVIGERPSGSPNLSDDNSAFQALADRLWRGGAETRVGKGRVVRGTDPDMALLAAGVPADFDYAKPQPDSRLLFAHRRLADGDIYFVSNRQSRAERIEARFAVTGKRPELWNAVTGSVTPLSYRIDGQQTVVPLDLGSQEAAFVVFREPTRVRASTVKAPPLRMLATLDLPWQVSFQTGRGAPEAVEMATLSPLQTHAEQGIRYFSGTATYRSSFSLPRGHKAGAPLSIDLGKVGDVAEVIVNGRSAGIVWLSPYRIDIGHLVRTGDNSIEIKVANLWTNRLIGDKQPGAKPVAFVAAPTYFPDAPLRPSGLIGPVTLIAPENGAAR